MSIKDFFTDWNDATKELSESEKSRLAMAIVTEATGGKAEVRGNEKYVFPIYSARLKNEKIDTERTV